MKSLIRLFVLGLTVSFCFSCHSGSSNKKNSSNGMDDLRANTLPKPDHILIVIDENHSFNEIIGAAHAPFINQLAKKGALFTNSHGVVHPSQPNYLAIFSGSTQGIKGDECLKDSTPFITPNLGASLIKAGYTFTGYAQTMPYRGYLSCYYKRSSLTKAYLYARKHCPWVNWQGTGVNNLPDSVSRPMTDFPSNFSKLPTVAFVIPDMDHDMHNPIPNVTNSYALNMQLGDSWLRKHLTNYIKWAQTHNSLFILPFDEDNFTPQNHIPTIFIGPMVKSGQYNDSINHYNVLRTIEAMYKLTPSGSAKETAITDVWR